MAEGNRLSPVPTSSNPSLPTVDVTSAAQAIATEYASRRLSQEPNQERGQQAFSGLGSETNEGIGMPRHAGGTTMATVVAPRTRPLEAQHQPLDDRLPPPEPPPEEAERRGSSEELVIVGDDRAKSTEVREGANSVAAAAPILVAPTSPATAHMLAASPRRRSRDQLIQGSTTQPRLAEGRRLKRDSSEPRQLRRGAGSTRAMWAASTQWAVGTPEATTYPRHAPSWPVQGLDYEDEDFDGEVYEYGGEGESEDGEKFEHGGDEGGRAGGHRRESGDGEIQENEDGQNRPSYGEDQPGAPFAMPPSFAGDEASTSGSAESMHMAAEFKAAEELHALLIEAPLKGKASMPQGMKEDIKETDSADKQRQSSTPVDLFVSHQKPSAFPSATRASRLPFGDALTGAGASSVSPEQSVLLAPKTPRRGAVEPAAGEKNVGYPKDASALPLEENIGEVAVTTTMHSRWESAAFPRGQSVMLAAGRTRARAPSIQIEMLPVLGEAQGDTSPAAQQSNGTAAGTEQDTVNLTRLTEEMSASQGEGQGQQQGHADAQSRRQHSTSNLVSLRRLLGQKQLSLELFEEDSDYSSSCGDGSESPRPEAANPVDTSDKKQDDDHPQWLLSTEGKSRLAQVAKATVIPTTRTFNYFKLFAPPISAHETYTVLATLHRRMNGTGWPRRGGWDSYLVRKSRAELDSGRVHGITSTNGVVESLVLSSNNVCGRIPADIARLNALKCINLSDNHLLGSIPAELGLLIRLQTLQLHGNNLRDTLSPLLGSLKNLVRLSLSNNKLSGSVPDSLGNLRQLKFLSVENNRLTGQIPSSICRLAMLMLFNASNNQLEGEIPFAIGGLRMLKKLDFGNNKLTGEIPSSLGTLKFLTWLRLNDNQLTGHVPAEFEGLTNVVILNLASNRLSGPMPTSVGSSLNLVSVNLRGNRFESPCPTPTLAHGHSHVSGLRTIDLGCNDLNEPFPDATGLRELLTLALDGNRLYGRLGGELAVACPNLYRLHLQKNRLTGEIPDSLGSLSKLEKLDLSDNCFEGRLPPTLESLKLLRVFSASNNKLSGDLPSFLGNLTLLTSLSLDGNQFGGTIPSELGNLTSLERLYLEDNELVGSIPVELSKCLSLEELYLHRNQLCEGIPDALRHLVELRYLYLHQNRLTGTVPEWIGELSQLRGLVLGDNMLTGVIPWQLGHLHKLENLYLNDNNLEGGIPERLVVNCDRLQRLYLGGNHLTGRVPRVLSHVRHLRECNIERNNLHGELPIPLFLKTSLGPNACGLKFGGNPRIVDSRSHFASTVVGLWRTDSGQASQAHHPRQETLQHSFTNQVSVQPMQTDLPQPEMVASNSARSLQEAFSGGSLKRILGGIETWSTSRFSETLGEKDLEDLSAIADDKGGVGRPWANSEDACYFLLKVLVGSMLVVLDCVVAARLYQHGCEWGAVLIVIWKVIAGLEGMAATRRLGYGKRWLLLAAVGLALPLQARRCFYHSCESDLFLALQKVEWRWHATIQLETQLAAAFVQLSGDAPIDLYYFWVSMAMKALVLGVVSMQRLDDKRLLRAEQKRVAPPPMTKVQRTWLSIFKLTVVPWFQASALPRLVLVGYHIAEVGERTIPLAALATALGDRAFLAPSAMLPGMVVRYVARRTQMAVGGDGVVSAVKSALEMALALDSAFGAGTPGHFFAAVATTVETVTFTSIATSTSRGFPDPLVDTILSACTIMLLCTWGVFVVEKVVPLGSEPPRLLPLPPPRLLFARFSPLRTTTTHVQPASCHLPRVDSASVDSRKTTEFGAWGAQNDLASVVPIEGTMENGSGP